MIKILKWIDDIPIHMVNIGNKAIDSGYANAWFSWLSWVGIVSVLGIAFSKSGSISLLILIVISILLLFCLALAAAYRITEIIVEKHIKSRPIWAFFLSIAIVGISLLIVSAIFDAFL